MEALAFSFLQKVMPNSLNCLRVLRMAHLEQIDILSKTFPDVSGDKARFAAQHSPKNGKSHGLTGNLEYSRAARSFRIMKTSLSSSKEITFLEVQNLDHKLIHRRKIPLFFCVESSSKNDSLCCIKSSLTFSCRSSICLCTANSS